MPRERPNPATADVAIIGGGIAGLWLLNRLSREGYSALLFEAGEIGAEQTLGSQGMIHGGLKYALAGALTGASEAIAGMPGRWRDCIDGHGEVDLSGLTPLSERYYLFAGGSSLERLTGFFASRMLRGRITRLTRENFPVGLKKLQGVVYGLEDFVLDTPTLLARLLEPVADRAYRQQIEPGALSRSNDGWHINLDDGSTLATRQLIVAAGAGAGALLRSLNVNKPQMQLRPLHQVSVQHPDLTPLYAHCLTGRARAEPRLTITSHAAPDGGTLWYLGGQLATSGVKRNRAEQIEHARAELAQCVPWIDWRSAHFDSYRFERAEPQQQHGLRPDQAFTAAIGEGAQVCWPTKLSLVPDLGDRVLAGLAPPSVGNGAPSALKLPPAAIGQPPWFEPGVEPAAEAADSIDNSNDREDGAWS